MQSDVLHTVTVTQWGEVERNKREKNMYERTAAEREKNPAGTGLREIEKRENREEDVCSTSVNLPHKVLIALARGWRHARPRFLHQRDALSTNLQ